MSSNNDGGTEKGQREIRGGRSNWRPEEINDLGNSGGFSLFEETLLVLEA